VSEMKEVCLGDYCEVFSGFAFRSNEFIDNSDNVVLVKGENIGQGRILWDISKYWSREKVDGLERFLLRPGDVVLAMDRPWVPAGLKYAWIREGDPDALLVQRVARLRAKYGLEQEFLRYIIGTPAFTGYIHNSMRGVGVPHISGRQIEDYRFRLPSAARQQKIAYILSTYDDLIENNFRRMALLEESARLLYREWFVRLRFPGHEHTRIVNGVPEEWRKGQVGDLGEIITGKTPSTEDESNYGDDVQFIKTPDMHRQLIIVETEQSLSEKGANSQSNKFIPNGSILVACIGAKLGVVSLTSERCQTNQQINAVIPHHDSIRYYSFFALRDLKPMLQAMGGGATMPNVNKNKFSGLSLLIPPHSLMATFNEVVNPVFSQLRTLLLHNNNLKAARDLLLPRLMSGEITV